MLLEYFFSYILTLISDSNHRRSKRFRTKVLNFWDFERIASIKTESGDIPVVAKEIPGEGTVIIGNDSLLNYQIQDNCTEVFLKPNGIEKKKKNVQNKSDNSKTGKNSNVLLLTNKKKLSPKQKTFQSVQENYPSQWQAKSLKANKTFKQRDSEGKTIFGFISSKENNESSSTSSDILHTPSQTKKRIAHRCKQFSVRSSRSIGDESTADLSKPKKSFIHYDNIQHSTNQQSQVTRHGDITDDNHSSSYGELLKM